MNESPADRNNLLMQISTIDRRCAIFFWSIDSPKENPTDEKS